MESYQGLDDCKIPGQIREEIYYILQNQLSSKKYYEPESRRNNLFHRFRELCDNSEKKGDK